MSRGYNTEVNVGGIGFSTLLLIVFIVLKLIGVIDWPWVWVLCHLWVPIVLIIAICITVALLIIWRRIFG